MAMFLMLFLLCAVLGYFAPKTPLSIPGKNGRGMPADRAALIVCLIPLFLICGLRAETVGLDTDNYVDSFLDPAVLDRTVGGEAKFELGYTLFVKLIRLFSDNPNVFIFATAVVIFAGLYLFIRNNCTGHYGIALLVYVAFLYYVDFSAIRQAMGISIAINCVPFLRKRQWIPAVLVILLGAMFHTTALLLLVMVPFVFVSWNKTAVVIAAALAVAGSLLFEPIVGVVLHFFPIYERYWNSEMMEGSGGVGMFAILVSALSAFAALMLFTGKAEFKKTFRRNEFVIALIGSIFTIAINLLGRKYGIFSRMTRYFIPFVMILGADICRCCIPNQYFDIDFVCGILKRCKLDKYCNLEKYKDRERYPVLAKCRIRMRDIYYLAVAGMMGIYFYTIMRVNLYGIIPYSFFFA